MSKNPESKELRGGQSETAGIPPGNKNSEKKMPSNKKSGPSYSSVLQICVAFTFAFVIFLTVKYSSNAIFDVKPELIRKLAYHDSQVQADKSRSVKLQIALSLEATVTLL